MHHPKAKISAFQPKTSRILINQFDVDKKPTISQKVMCGIMARTTVRRIIRAAESRSVCAMQAGGLCSTALDNRKPDGFYCGQLSAFRPPVKLFCCRDFAQPELENSCP